MTIVACTPTTITPGTVQFNSVEFLAQYPMFAVQAPALAGNFALATTQLNNGCGSAVQDAPTRQQLLYLLTAHITQLLNGIGSQQATGVVGRVSDAGEGSVSMAAEFDSKAGPSKAYYIQTSYGAAYWQMTAQFRTAQYFAPPCNPCDTSYPWGYGGGSGCGC
jgi:Protein of unknown function (DUF4054)